MSIDCTGVQILGATSRLRFASGVGLEFKVEVRSRIDRTRDRCDLLPRTV